MTGRGWRNDRFDTGLLAAVFGERFDRLMTVEVRPVDGGLPPGIVVRLYEICRRYHGEPLSTLAARRLAEVVGEGDTVLIVTGFGVPPNLPFGETDGPPGAAVLARALAKGFGAHVVLVTEEAHLAPVAAAGNLLGNTLNGHGINHRRELSDRDRRRALRGCRTHRQASSGGGRSSSSGPAPTPRAISMGYAATAALPRASDIFICWLRWRAAKAC